MPPPGVCLNIMESRHKTEGYGSFSNPNKFFNQDHQQLKHDCLIQRVSFIDETFPPNQQSIGPGILSPNDLANLKWLRPANISPNPAFILQGISRFDFRQGELGNCWFLASIGALTFKKCVFEQIIPSGQTFDKNYCGLFHFRFWRFGKWVDVVIDDKLPTINGRLIFVHSKDPNEFWPALMEKAYAKVCGSYTDMSAGTPAEALMDFTGGVHMSILLSEPPSNLFELMNRAGSSSALMACATPLCGSTSNTLSSNGLVLGHAYTVTGVEQVTTNRGKVVNLVRLWNPWGKGEWNGDWSDRSPLWQTVTPEKRLICLSIEDNGEFWMTVDDFCSFYSDLDICGMSPDFLDRNSSRWWTLSYEGQWVAGTTAGGCGNNTDSFWTNPQYPIEIRAEQFDSNCEKNLLVSLLQKHDKRNRHQVQNHYIGLYIFEVKEKYQPGMGKFPASFFSSHAPVAQSKSYRNSREVMEFLFLTPGHYVIVPSTYDPNKTASFLLTLYSKDEICSYDNSGDDEKNFIEKPQKVKNAEEDENKRAIFHQLIDKYNQVDAEQLQRLLNDNVLKGDLKSGGFSIEACRSMVALMDAHSAVKNSFACGTRLSHTRMFSSVQMFPEQESCH
ncbi:calpain-1 catalytic subunit-like isoform X2 [Gouania willdenowi]|uniref:calpain-1 catalytic subunit-like isoform X2 n=1 Tax=Gouania willdenowi TaxID=441366 RepID=UPI001056E0D1|nr:calpain-1 catalytic subunit-like isoform X2 [Gouania willdenowi]